MLMAKTKNPGIREAIETMKEFGLLERMRIRMFYKNLARMDRITEDEFVRNEGIAEGITQGTANSLIEVLAKFGEVPDGILQKVQSQKNLEILQDWFKKAIKAESLEEWVKSIKELTQEQTNK
ncbi:MULTISPECIES: hypothetical protein [Lachnospiraceae]|mgnify:FL=1|jgi:hypothetical protein|uniref:Uncharacterized protein n=2 Tax=Lachnospiraceae TaxID=186803 RepID=A0A7G9FUF2_9FIRM|nr:MULTISPECIES: hypothetical protein [Lachnospiraceae]MST59033.1 hypothetical protein [Waltera intestinalis]QNM02184.1 hypothetical protein H9Q77_14085 [Simiaoa sunii]